LYFLGRENFHDLKVKVKIFRRQNYLEVRRRMETETSTSNSEKSFHFQNNFYFFQMKIFKIWKWLKVKKISTKLLKVKKYFTKIFVFVFFWKWKFSKIFTFRSEYKNLVKYFSLSVISLKFFYFQSFSDFDT